MPIDMEILLKALAVAETGAFPLAIRHEKAYCYGGFYYTGPNGSLLRELSDIWGCLAHCSFSPWQIMYIAAVELGFKGDPIALRESAIAKPYVMKYIQKRILDRYPRITIEGVVDAWNTGRPDDVNFPRATYAKKILDTYAHLISEEPFHGAVDRIST